MKKNKLILGKDGEIYVTSIDCGNICVIGGEITIPKRIPGS